MKIIDFHTHIWPDDIAKRAIEKITNTTPGAKAFSDGTLNGLKNSMNQAGINCAVILPIATKPTQVETINNSCKNLMSDRIVPFGTIYPKTKKFPKDIEYLANIGVKGIKMHPEYQNFYIQEKKYFPIYEILQHKDLILVFHAGKDPGPFLGDHALPDAIKKVHQNFPKLKIVAAHMGGWMLWKQVEKEIIDLPIFFDTSATRRWIGTERFLRMIKKHGTEKILFGTDSPWFNQKKDVEWLYTLKVSWEDKEKIFYKNAKELLKINL
jgi:predicted TIM-barrel fold metal-dependent hydrolase